MRANTSRRHRFAFDDVAEVYDAGRPRFDGQLVEDILRRAGLTPGDAVLEIGAGTGQLTGGLLEAGLDVLALEPGHHLAEILRRRLAARGTLRVVEETFEDYTGGARFAAILSANAFHWVDPVIGLPKVRDLLRPSAPLVTLWNYPILENAELQTRLNDEVFVEDLEGYRRDPISYEAQVEALVAGGREELEASGLFSRFDWTLTRRRLALTLDGYIDLLNSYANGVALRGQLAGKMLARFPDDATFDLIDYVYVGYTRE